MGPMDLILLVVGVLLGMLTFVGIVAWWERRR